VIQTKTLLAKPDLLYKFSNDSTYSIDPFITDVGSRREMWNTGWTLMEDGSSSLYA
jgi:hypothetical protein